MISFSKDLILIDFNETKRITKKNKNLGQNK
jgi:hypothetical protein